MLGQAHTSRRRLLALAALALATLAIPAIGGADPSQSAQALRSLDAQLEAKQRSAVLGLYALDQQLATTQTRLWALHAQTVALRAQEARLRYERRLAQRDTRIAQAGLVTRLQTLYDEGTVSSVEILLGARSLDEALNELDGLNATTSQDEAVLRQLQSARAQLARASQGVAGREAAVRADTQAAEATAASLAASRAQRSAYVASLASQRSLTEAQVVRVVAQARAAAARTTRIQHASFEAAAIVRAGPTTTTAAPSLAEPFATATPGAAATSSAQTLTVTATGYALGGTTATGLPVGWGVAAVDPSVIPLGTHFTVPGYGEAVAADTGGAVWGDTIDLWFPTTEQADAWGRRTVTIVLH